MTTTQQLELLQAQFLQEVSQILDPTSSEGDSLFNYIRRTKKQLVLNDLEVREVISEAATRGLDHIRKKQEAIRNSQAWLRKVCSHIMYDMVKDEIRTRQLKVKNTGTFEIPDSFSKIESEETRQALEAAFAKLSEEDKQILQLRFYKGMQYKEIQKYYFRKTGIEVKIPTLRQRESRALKRLRERFQEAYNTEKPRIA